MNESARQYFARTLNEQQGKSFGFTVIVEAPTLGAYGAQKKIEAGVRRMRGIKFKEIHMEWGGDTYDESVTESASPRGKAQITLLIDGA